MLFLRERSMSTDVTTLRAGGGGGGAAAAAAAAAAASAAPLVLRRERSHSLPHAEAGHDEDSSSGDNRVAGVGVDDDRLRTTGAGARRAASRVVSFGFG